MESGPERRLGWLRIAGPLAGLLLGVLAAVFYLRPVSFLRFVQLTRLGWAGVSRQEISLPAGLMAYLITAGYWDQEPVILVHGTSPEAALIWRDVMPLVSEAHYKVLAPDLIGFGASEHKQAPYGIAYQAQALDQFITALKLEHVNLVGHGLGSDVVLYYAVDHPDKVERIVLVSGGLIGPVAAARLRALLLPNDPVKLREAVARSFYGLPPMPDFLYERMVQEVAADLPARGGLLESVPRDEAHIHAHLDRIFNTLTGIFWGSKDEVETPAQAERLHTLLPGSGTAIFKDSGHRPQLEHPEEFADTLLLFLKSKEGGR